MQTTGEREEILMNKIRQMSNATSSLKVKYDKACKEKETLEHDKRELMERYNEKSREKRKLHDMYNSLVANKNRYGGQQGEERQLIQYSEHVSMVTRN